MKRKRKRAKGSVRHLRRVVKRLRSMTGGRKRVHGRRRRHSGRRLPLRLLIERRDRLEQLIGERMARGKR